MLGKAKSKHTVRDGLRKAAEENLYGIPEAGEGEKDEDYEDEEEEEEQDEEEEEEQEEESKEGKEASELVAKRPSANRRKELHGPQWNSEHGAASEPSAQPTRAAENEEGSPQPQKG